MPNDQYANEASTSRCKRQLVQLRSSNRAVSSNSNNWRRMAEIKQLDGRLEILEEEGEMLKGALQESVEESKTLITDIHVHFHTIQRHLLQRGGDTGESHSHVFQLVKERRAGLQQILYQEENPSIVNKGLKSKALLEDSNEADFQF